MTIEPVSNSQSAIAATTSAEGGQLGKDQFLKLLVTQLKNQDPLQPTDAQAMVAQLAQFSSLEQMQNLNTQFESSRRDNAWIQSLSLSGKPVHVELKDGSTIDGAVEQITWNNGALTVRLNGQDVAMGDIAAVAAVVQ